MSKTDGSSPDDSDTPLIQVLKSFEAKPKQKSGEEDLSDRLGACSLSAESGKSEDQLMNRVRQQLSAGAYEKNAALKRRALAERDRKPEARKESILEARIVPGDADTRNIVTKVGQDTGVVRVFRRSELNKEIRRKSAKIKSEQKSTNPVHREERSEFEGTGARPKERSISQWDIEINDENDLIDVMAEPIQSFFCMDAEDISYLPDDPSIEENGEDVFIVTKGESERSKKLMKMRDVNLTAEELEKCKEDFHNQASQLAKYEFDRIETQGITRMSQEINLEPLAGLAALRMHIFWGHGLDYHPLFLDHFSAWARGLYLGEYQFLEECLQTDDRPTLQEKLLRRESLLKLNSLFHVVIGASVLNRPAEQSVQEKKVIDSLDFNQVDHAQCLRSLLNIGCDANIQDGAGYTPLTWVVWSPPTPLMLQLAEILIRYHADPNRACRGGNTPLMTAVNLGHREYIDLLLKAGGNPYIKNNDGLCALDLTTDSKLRHQLVTGSVDDLITEMKKKKSDLCSVAQCVNVSRFYCQECYKVRYCSRECQGKDKEHKSLCRQMASNFVEIDMDYSSDYLEVRLPNNGGTKRLKTGFRPRRRFFHVYGNFFPSDKYKCILFCADETLAGEYFCRKDQSTIFTLLQMRVKQHPDEVPRFSGMLKGNPNRLLICPFNVEFVSLSRVE